MRRCSQFDKCILLACLMGLSLGCSSPPEALRSDGGGDAGYVEPASDLPCDVAELLGSRCVPCHADPPRGSSVPLASHAQLAGPAPSDPSRSAADVALQLMQSPTGPMPPAPAAPPTAAEIAIMQAFVDDGAPMGTCAVNNPFDTPEVCSTDSYWRGGNHESAGMRPGWACIDCHESMREGPFLSVAGTVYASAHEPDDCYGASSDGTDSPVVEITDSEGRVGQIPVNRAGNFLTQTIFSLPFTARVLYQGRSREMLTPLEDGDCNSCHTNEGANGAPGRILLP